MEDVVCEKAALLTQPQCVNSLRPGQNGLHSWKKKQGKSEGFDSCNRPSNLTQIGFKSSIFQPVWPWNLMNDLKKQYCTSSILCQALCIISYPLVGELKLELQSGNAQFRSKSAIFLSCVTLKFNGWPWKTIGYLFYTASSLVYHFKAIGESKLELQSQNTQSRSKSAIFCPVWPCNLTDDLQKQ